MKPSDAEGGIWFSCTTIWKGEHSVKNHFQKIISVGICSILLISALTGCSSQSNVTNLMEDFSQDDNQDTASSDSLSQADKGNEEKDIVLSSANAVTYTDFAVRLFQESLNSEENTLISPLSVINALAMTANGAKGDTLSQMEQLFGTELSSLNGYLSEYSSALPAGEKYKLHMANSIWFRDAEGFLAEESFLQTNQRLYNAGIYKAPFDGSTLKDINQWVAENTDNMIPKILNDIPADAVMYLINALAFDAEWQSPYQSYDIYDDIFTTESNIEKNVSMMHSEENTLLQDINENGDTLALGFLKYYADGKYAFAALLPGEGMDMERYVETLTGEHLNKMLTEATNADIRASLPKFEAEYSIGLKEILQDMGMTTPFDPEKADFSGLGSSPYGNLYISNVIHKTFITVDGQGTKAGAATAVEICCESASIEIVEPIYITLDRPFVYMIIDCEENLPVFIGTVMEP